ncbi:MAG: polysaccharide biosynthesis C-terminal domain-containing protein [Candidatus Thermoplasmatota archaeon]|nr:polysaccharide biosynthesis C-terminal domain-containing protein [Candidatus Thermoplasmatota archaeon]MBU4592192.1 polysaccharide biosynthesis C-terminal domain-containing protein [Candidatus Thermoplasmatota archaeon]
MIAKNSFIIMITQGTCAVLGMFGLFAISKIWGEHAPGIMGVVWFGMSFVGAFSFITNLGFDAAHVKKISEGKDLGKCNGTYIAIKLILTGIFAASVISTIIIWKYVLNEQFYDSTRESVIYLFIAYYVFFSLAQIPIMTLNSLKKNAKSQISILSDTVMRVFLLLIIALAGISGALIVTDAGTQIVNVPARYVWPAFFHPIQAFLSTHIIGAISFAYIAGALSMFVVGFIMLRKYPISRPDKEYMSMYLRFAVPMMIPVLFSFLNSYLDKVILGYYWTSVEVGYYFAVQRISFFVMLVPSAIGIVLFPTISSMYVKYRSNVKKRNHQLVQLTRFSERYISMVTVPLVSTFIVFAVPLIDIILNSSFRPGTLSMQILFIYTYVTTMYVPIFFLVLGTNRPQMIAKAFVLSGVSNIVLNLFLIPRDGLLSFVGIDGAAGAAFATLISALIMCWILLYYSGRIMKRGLFEKRIILHIVAGIIAGLLMLVVSNQFDIIQWYHLISLTLIGLGAYLGILFALGEFRKAELNFFLDTVNPLGLLRHVRDEMRGKGT